MKLAVLKPVAKHVARVMANPASPTRSLRTLPVVMRQAQGGEGSNVPATTSRGSTALGFPGLGFASPISHRFREIEQEMEDMMRGFGLSLAPLAESPALRGAMSLAVDVKDNGDAYLIHADVPGMRTEDVKIEVSPDRVLTMSGERKEEKKEEGEGGFVRMERSYGSFTRSFRLPPNVDANSIKAEMNNGVLQLTVPKKEEEETKSKTISIEVGGAKEEIDQPNID